MGVGKSTVAKELARRLRYPFIDLDAYIEYKTESSISSLFQTKGEDHFRDLEYSFLQEILKNDDQVIALGGGSLTHHSLDRSLRKKALLIYLEADAEFLYDRLVSEKDHRPLIADKSDAELSVFINEQISERENQYLNAQLRINVKDKSKEEIASFVEEYLQMI